MRAMSPVIRRTTSSGLVASVFTIAGDAPVAQDDDAVGDLERLRHDVGDDDDPDAAPAHPVDGLEAAAGLLDAERREGLVEHHQLAAPVHEAVELDRLALAARQVLDGDAQRGMWVPPASSAGGSRPPSPLAAGTGCRARVRVSSRPMKKFATTSTLVQSDRSW